MRHLTVSILVTLAVLLGSAGEVWSLPPCPAERHPTNSPWSNCFGTWTFASGNKYVGEYKDDKQHGQGTATYADGSKYVGEWKDGKHHGQGTVTNADGDKYVGEYRDGKQHGQGTLTTASGSKYVGELKDGKPHGQGTFTTASGSKYVGEWKDGKHHGQGTFTSADGSKYVGEYKNSKKHGQGTYTDADGRVEEGIWENGSFKYAQKVTPTVTVKKTPKIKPKRNAPQAPSIIGTSEKTPKPKPAKRVAKKTEPKVDQQKRLELTRRTQEALEVLGLYSGKLDGIIGVKTKSAIQRWQKRNGYSGTGEVTELQLAKLEQEAITHLAKEKSEPKGAKKKTPKPKTPQFKKVPKRPDDIAVIIANSNYKKLGKGIPNVTPAYADAEGIKRYFMNAKGVREGNIIYLKDATKAQMTSVFGSEKDHKGKLFNWVKSNVSKVYVYYAGHGAPAGDEGTTYLVPSDTDNETVQLTAYPLKQLYSNLGKIPATSITVILEACFSGQSQGGTLFSKTSGISIVPRMPLVPSKITVISAGAAKQVASWEKDSSQSLFTKYFLMGMSGEGDRKPYGNGDGKVSLKELKKFLNGTMTYYARRYYGRTQTAQMIVNGRELSVSN